jgi:hypothetical protein
VSGIAGDPSQIRRGGEKEKGRLEGDADVPGSCRRPPRPSRRAGTPRAGGAWAWLLG